MASTLNLKTPGVYIQEVSLFPPSVAQVETAIPAFIGYTRFAEKDGKDITGKALKIKSMVDYRTYFGGGPDREITVNLGPTNAVKSVEMQAAWYLHDSLMMFFANGGEKCYIVSVGSYASTVSQTDFTNALDELKKHDEPTLIVMPDAMLINNPAQIAAVQQKAIDLCNALQDRFAILDVKIADLNKTETAEQDIAGFRSGVSNFLKYGAAYYPWLKTSLPFEVSFMNLTIKKNDDVITLDQLLNTVAKTSAGTTVDAIQGDLDTLIKIYPIKADYLSGAADAKKKAIDDALNTFTGIAPTDFKTEEIKTSFDNYVKADSQELKDVQKKVEDLKENSTADDYKNTFEAVVAFITNFQANTELRLAKAKEQLPAGEATSRLVADALTLKSDNRKYAITGSPDAVLPDSAAYFNTQGTANKKIFIDTALKKFTGLTPITKFENFDVRLGFSNYQNAVTANGRTYSDLLNAISALNSDQPESKFNQVFEDVVSYINSFWADLNNRLKAKALEIRSKVPIFNTIVSAAETQGIILPPSGAVAGVYASVDENRGVWKAPANVGISNVVGPTVLITDSDQESLNVDVDAGKSINAIRFFTGKGTLVWGARTLAGNDNEWRYVSVRRFFIMVEESVKKASGQFVFEPNDANTWVKVRAMIENFLTLQWRAGALAGIKPEHAFFVRVGLGQTMTADDILNGRMIVEIGMAVVRPAEFIVLRFSHKMQES